MCGIVHVDRSGHFRGQTRLARNRSDKLAPVQVEDCRALTNLLVFLKGATKPLTSTPSISGNSPRSWSGDGGCCRVREQRRHPKKLAISRDLSAKRPTLTGPVGERVSSPSSANSPILPFSRLNLHAGELERALRRFGREAAHLGGSDADALVERCHLVHQSRAPARGVGGVAPAACISREQRRKLQPRRPQADVIDGHLVDAHANALRRRDRIGASCGLAVEAVILVVVRLLRIEDGGSGGGIEVTRDDSWSISPVILSALPACWVLTVKVSPLDLHGRDLAVLDVPQRRARIDEVARHDSAEN